MALPDGQQALIGRGPKATTEQSFLAFKMARLCRAIFFFRALLVLEALRRAYDNPQELLPHRAAAKMSQLLLRLQRELATEADPIRRAESQARLACALSRFGRFAEARENIASLRALYGDGRHGRVTVWIMVAEALDYYFSNEPTKALDRLTRAQFLSGAIRYPTVHALSSAWKAQVEFHLSSYDAMLRSLRLAMSIAEPQDHEVQSRIAILMFEISEFFGNRQEAQKWFHRGREHVLREGDQSGIEALQYNRAVFGLAHLRVQEALELMTSTALRLARAEYESSRNLQALTGVEALTGYLALCGARLKLLEGNYDAAMAAMKTFRAHFAQEQHHISEHLLDLEIGYCLFKTGRTQEALELLAAVDFSSFGDLDLDEQLVGTYLRCVMARADVAFGDVATLEAQLDELKGIYLSTKAVLEQGLADLSDLLPRP